MQVHRKQYVLGPVPYSAGPDWESQEIGTGLHLSFSPDLAVKKLIDMDGTAWWLLGLAVPVIDEDIETAIQKTRTQNVPSKLHYLAGEWQLVGPGLHMDACGLLGCYYSIAAKWASSSPAILADILGVSPDEARPKIKHGINWDPPPCTRYRKIRRLLPSQILNLPDFSIAARPLIWSTTPMPYEAILEDADFALQRAFQGLTKRYDRVFVTVTDGFDSRLMLAAAAAAGAKPIGITFSNEIVKTGVHMVDTVLNPGKDRILPPLLCRAVGVKHLFVQRARFNPEYDNKFSEHTADAAMDGPARSRFGYGQMEFGLTNRDVVVKGSCLEIARARWKKHPSPLLTLDGLIANLDPSESGDGVVREGLTKWLEWTGETPNPGLDLRDRFYWEQRMGGWGSAISQSFGLADGSWINLANSSYFLNLLLRVPVEKRKEAIHQIDLIRRMAPELLAWPFNPPEHFFWRKVRKVAQNLKLLPQPRSYSELDSARTWKEV
jgi:hypothetical protein